MVDWPDPPRYLKHVFVLALIADMLVAYFLIDISKDTVIELIQFVALALPAAAIYLQIFSGFLDSENHDSQGLEPQIHQIRLVFMFLALSGMLLISALFFFEFNSMNSVLQLLIDFLVILSMAAMVGTLGMFGSSVAYWPRALRTETTIWYGIQQSFFHIKDIRNWENIESAVKIIDEEGPLSVEQLNEKFDSYFTGWDYARQLKEWGLKHELITLTDNNKMEITEQGEDFLEGDVSVDELRAKYG